MLNKLTLLLLCGLMGISTAHAHVTIRNLSNGVDSISGKSDQFRLNVPTNRHKAIVAIKLHIPDEAQLLFIHPMPNWTYGVEKNTEGKVHTVHYRGRMEAGEYTSFPFILKNPAKSDTTVKYRVYVTYEDGIVVPFDGSEAAHGYQPTILLK